MDIAFIESDENSSKLLIQNKAIMKQIVKIKKGFIDFIYFFMIVICLL